jgi:MinD-like ATPase involved in chromosome partitioning or flagellar assembly
MYTITFYSFKGGVGRTMAMANVGLSLARAGRRVLLVDFDLEAPGLDTFSLLRPDRPTPGIVDYVTEFRNTGIAPDVTKFVYEPSHPGLDATVWVMPSGKQDEHYGSRLNSIDWNQLYIEQDGYLLFEDLKEQVERQLRPDYVFVDSRTGHTDTGGICTRQLPDAVVLLFFPNEQNRRGLEMVARDIRQETRESGRLIDLYYVASNVPDLDDEDSKLRERLRQFRRTLEADIDATIHHYDSLSLIEQTVFTIERPHTKLAREYDRLAKKITSRNLGDRDVVLDFLESILDPRRGDDPKMVKKRLSDIRSSYSNDGKVLYELGQAYRGLGLKDDGDKLLVEAEKQGFLSEDKLRDKAVQEYSSGSLESARLSVLRVLEIAKKPVFVLERLWSVVLAKDPEFLPELLQALNSRKLQPTEKLYAANALCVRRDVLPIIEEFLLRPLAITDDNFQDSARSELALCLIGQRRYAEAQAVIKQNAPTPSGLGIQDSFNYAIAEWGSTKTIPRDLFLQVIELDAATSASGTLGANYLQCLAIANWAAGRFDEARECSKKSRDAALQYRERNREPTFSAWRYLSVTHQEFLSDLDALDKMMSIGIGQPTIVCDQD